MLWCAARARPRRAEAEAPLDPTRRAFLGAGAALAGAALAGCATPGAAGGRAAAVPAPASWAPDEAARLEASPDVLPLVLRGAPDAGVLRRWARPVPAGLDLTAIAARLARTMEAEGGVGLAAPQVGLLLRAAVVLHGWRGEHPRLVFARNPVVVERSDDTIDFYEACLSVPGVGGLVRRSRWVRVHHEAPDGATLETEAEGADAVLWQHELDHLDGVLYTDRAQGELLPIEELRRRREEQERDRGEKPSAATDAARARRLASL